MLARAGVRHRRLHRAVGQQDRVRRPAARLPRARPSAVRGQGRHGLHRGRAAEAQRAAGGLASGTSPFADAVRERRAHWVRPELVAEVAFTEWTRDGMLRHPRFLGLREDKDPREVVREEPPRR
ncbi:ATP dependent DNA ligase [Streptomyces buecherae]